MAHFYLPHSNSTFIEHCQLSKDTMVMAGNQTFTENKFLLYKIHKRKKVIAVSIIPIEEDDGLVKRLLLHTVPLLPSFLK